MSKILFSIWVVVFVVVILFAGAQIDSCSKAGGTLVRGLFLFECIK